MISLNALQHAVLLAGLLLAAFAVSGCGSVAESPAMAKTPAAVVPEASPSGTPPRPTRTAIPTVTPTSALPTPVPPTPTQTPPRYPDDYEPPDLQMLPPTDLFIQPNEINGQPELRFTTSVVNLGLGPLIMIGEYDEETGRTRAVQQIRTESGEMTERVVGYFVFHPAHDHWHFEDFNVFELWTYDEDGEHVDLLSTSGKASWCITETSIADPLPEVFDPYALLAGCDPIMQAIANGWVDTYDWPLPGQQLDISGLPDGRYAFCSTTDPDNRIVEVDEDNNSLTVYIEIVDGRVITLDEP